MKAARATVLAGLIAGTCSAANAWFFFFIPGGAISAIADKAAGVEGDHCVGAAAKVGDIVTLANGSRWKVETTSGASDRCQNASLPIRAKVQRVYTPAEMAIEQTACIPQGPGPGAIVRVRELSQEMQVVRLTGKAECTVDHSSPVQAIVRLPPNAPRAPSDFAPVPVADPAPPVAQQPLAVGKLRASQEPKSVPDRLRQLKQLREENLITQEVYEAKQRDILADQ